MRKSILAIGFLFACCLVPSEAVCRPMIQVSPSIKLGFGPSKQGQIGLVTEFIDYVDNAKKTLDGAFFEIRLDSVVDAFIRAKKRGVKVRLVVDSNYYYLPPDPATEDDTDVLTPQPLQMISLKRNQAAAEPILNPFIARLIKAGIPVIEDSMRGSLMHNKFGIRDGETVWTGSYNLTDTCSHKNPNNAVQIKSPELAKIFTDEFNEMFIDRSFGITSTKHAERQIVKVDDALIEVFFAPEDNPNGRIGEAIAEATQEVCFMQFAFTADELRDLLIKRHKEGLKVRGIFDRMLYRSTGPYGEFSHLTEVGIPVKIYPEEGKFHHKVFLIDPDGDSPKVVLGSTNASTNGNRSNDENILVIHSRKVAENFKKEFESFFGNFSDAAAFMQVADLPFAGQTINMGELHVFANGKGIERIKVEYPARWKVENLGRNAVSVLRNGRETTENEEIKFFNNSFVLNSANLSESGKNSSVSLRFHNIPAPTIPGKYAVLVSVAYSGDPAKFVPMHNNPTVWVFDPEKSEDFGRLLDYIQKLHSSLEAMKSGQNQTQQKNQLNIFKLVINKLQNMLCQAIQTGEFERTDMALTKIEKLPQRWHPFILSVSNNMKPLREALQHKVMHDNDNNAARLLARIEKFILNAAR